MIKNEISKALVWPVMILAWIVLTPVYIGVWIYMRVTGKRIWFGR